MNKTNLLIFSLIALLLALGAAIYLQKEEPTEISIDEQPPAIHEEQSKPGKVPIVHYPVVETAAETAESTPSAVAAENATSTDQPTAAGSRPDSAGKPLSLTERLNLLVPQSEFFQLLILDNFIPRLVVTIDNLPEKKLPQAHLPLTKPKGRFLVSGTDDAPETSARNHQRYLPYVQLLESLDPELVVKSYRALYPLFQTAYKQLGYQNAYFNDRLVQVLDHLQTTPDISEPIPLLQPTVLYTFAAPSQEKLSAGQKTLLRVGPENRQRILKVLAEYRQRIVTP